VLNIWLFFNELPLPYFNYDIAESRILDSFIDVTSPVTTHHGASDAIFLCHAEQSSLSLQEMKALVTLCHDIPKTRQRKLMSLEIWLHIFHTTMAWPIWAVFGFQSISGNERKSPTNVPCTIRLIVTFTLI